MKFRQQVAQQYSIGKMQFLPKHPHTQWVAVADYVCTSHGTSL